jgi:hypothetical protein
MFPGPISCPYSPECVEWAFSEVRFKRVLRSSPMASIGPRAGVGAKRRCHRRSVRRNGSPLPPGRRSLRPRAGRHNVATRRVRCPLPPRTRPRPISRGRGPTPSPTLRRWPPHAASPSPASGRQAAAKRAGGRASRATSAGGWSCSPRATRRGSASPRRAS